MNALRFAIVGRTSTLQQAETGESLAVQEKQLRETVARHGGIVARRYIGAEHATPGHERPMLEQVLADAREHRIDAIMVVDASRWTRDNRRNKEALATLMAHGVRFFDIHREYDLNLPDSGLMLGVFAEMNEYVARINARKSAQSRIERAKRGWPSAGTWPFGRRLPEGVTPSQGQAPWEMIPEAQARVRQMYELYVVQGKNLHKVGRILGANPETIRRILRNQCGSIWTQKFKLDRKIITVQATIPALLTDEEIHRVHERAKSNQVERQTKRIYPLAHVVRCPHCGSSFSGHTSVHDEKEHSYYIHLARKVTPACTTSIRADLLHDEIFYHLGTLLRNSTAMQSAIEAAQFSGKGRREELTTELNALDGQIAQFDAQQMKLAKRLAILGLADDSSFMEKAGRQIAETEQKLADLRRRRQEIKSALESTMDPIELGQTIRAALVPLTSRHLGMPMHWPPNAQAALATAFFGGRTRWDKGRTRGIFVRRSEDESGAFWTYEAKGLIGSITGALATGDYSIDERYHDRSIDRPFQAPDLAKTANVLVNLTSPTDFRVHYAASRRWSA